MKITLIGPLKPYKGGISMFNTSLLKELEVKHSVQIISWKKRFPSFLYPAGSQVENNGEAKIKKQPNVFKLVIYNPLTWISSGLQIRKQKPDKLIFTWITPYFSPIIFTIALLNKFKAKCKLIIICHNVLPHESSIIDKPLRWLGFVFMDKFIVHAKTEKENLPKWVIIKKEVVTAFMPPFDLYKSITTNKASEEKVKQHTINILYFGIVREYKGLDILIKALGNMKDNYSFNFKIVGEFWDDIETYKALISAEALQERVQIVDNYVPDEEVSNYFTWCDFVVLPYKHATQSAIIQIAKSFNTPIVSTKTGGIPEEIEDGENGYLATPSNVKSLQENIIKMIQNPLFPTKENFNDHTWKEYIMRILT